MTVILNPYLSFCDDARAAMEFYRSVFGGDLELSTFGETRASEDPADADKVMHAMLRAPSGIILMGADTPASMPHTPPGGTSVSLSGDEEGTLRGYWEALSEGGSVTVPFERAPWGDWFGMCVDRFGTSWLVNASAAPAQP